LRDDITDELRRRILRGELAPGTRLGESNLAADLGVSRIPLREAFRCLESEGLLEWTFRRGVRVVGTTSREAETVEEIRLALELLAVRLVVERRDDEFDERLRGFLADGERASGEGDVLALAELDHRFHRLLAEGSGSPLLGRMLQTVRQRADQITASPSEGGVRSSWADHAAIVRLVLDGAAEAGQARMREHLRTHREHRLPLPS
jgi:DNA-binding GntR family transcriptional regulator